MLLSGRVVGFPERPSFPSRGVRAFAILARDLCSEVLGARTMMASCRGSANGIGENSFPHRVSSYSLTMVPHSALQSYDCMTLVALLLLTMPSTGHTQAWGIRGVPKCPACNPQGYSRVACSGVRVADETGSVYEHCPGPRVHGHLLVHHHFPPLPYSSLSSTVSPRRTFTSNSFQHAYRRNQTYRP